MESCQNLHQENHSKTQILEGNTKPWFTTNFVMYHLKRKNFFRYATLECQVKLGTWLVESKYSLAKFEYNGVKHLFPSNVIAWGLLILHSQLVGKELSNCTPLLLAKIDACFTSNDVGSAKTIPCLNGAILCNVRKLHDTIYSLESIAWACYHSLQQIMKTFI